MEYVIRVSHSLMRENNEPKLNRSHVIAGLGHIYDYLLGAQSLEIHTSKLIRKPVASAHAHAAQG